MFAFVLKKSDIAFRNFETGNANGDVIAEKDFGVGFTDDAVNAVTLDSLWSMFTGRAAAEKALE